MAGVLQLVQQVLVGVVVGLHVHGGAGFVPGADVVAQALVGQRGVVVPLGGALVLDDAVQGIQGFLIKSAADVVGRGAQFGAFLAGGVGLARPAGGAVIPKPERSKAKPAGSAAKGVAVLLVVAALLAVSLLAVAALGIAVAAIVLAAALLHPHDLAVGGLYFFKMLLGGWVVGVQVGMVLLAFLAVGFFDGLVVGTGGDAQNAVRIGHFCFPSLCLRIGAYLLHTPE